MYYILRTIYYILYTIYYTILYYTILYYGAPRSIGWCGGLSSDVREGPGSLTILIMMRLVRVKLI